MLVTMKTILDAAREGGYCVAAPNVMDDKSAKAIINAAERMNSPVIIDVAPSAFKGKDFYRICATCAELAKDTKVPVAVNLDHGKNFEQCLHGLTSECTSIMADRSTLPFEENVKEVKQLAEMAHFLGKSIESELGHVGTNVGAEKEVDSSKTIESEDDVRSNYTNVQEAIEYVKQTGIDCLAVAVGTVHGAYPEGVVPTIDFDLIRELRDAVPVPLVVHGGSGTALDDMAKLGPAGICKINVMADFIEAGIRYTAKFVEDHDGYEKLYRSSTLEMKKFIDAFYKGYEDKLVEYIEILGSKDKA